MITLNRRQIVFGAGAMVGLAGTNATSAHFRPTHSSPDATAVLQEIRLRGESEQRFLQRLGTGGAPYAALPAETLPRRGQQVEAQVFVQQELGGQVATRALAFLCDATRQNYFTVGGRPLVVRRFSYSTPQIAWSPGTGLPFYTSFAPRFDYDAAARYPAAKWHQIVPLLGSDIYFTGCQGCDVGEVSKPAPLSFDVNNSDFSDNRGSYLVVLWSWS